MKLEQTTLNSRHCRLFFDSPAKLAYDLENPSELSTAAIKAAAFRRLLTSPESFDESFGVVEASTRSTNAFKEAKRVRAKLLLLQSEFEALQAAVQAAAECPTIRMFTDDSTLTKDLTVCYPISADKAVDIALTIPFVRNDPTSSEGRREALFVRLVSDASNPMPFWAAGWWIDELLAQAGGMGTMTLFVEESAPHCSVPYALHPGYSADRTLGRLKDLVSCGTDLYDAAHVHPSEVRRPEPPTWLTV